MSAPTSATELAAQTLEQVGAVLPGAEVAVEATEHEMALTRFAESVIHQNVAEALATVRVVVHHAGRTASTTGSAIGPSSWSSTDTARSRPSTYRSSTTLRS